MKRLLTRSWLTGSSLILAAAVFLGTIVMHNYDRVNAEDMLNISLSIKAISHVTTDHVGDSVWGSQVGSGFLASKERCEVWTNHHVVRDAAIIEIFPRGWGSTRGIPAKLINATPRYDIAILEMESCDVIQGEARLSDSSLLRQGDEVYAVGNPLGKNPDTISRGIISHTERYIDDPLSYLQTDAIIGPGSSGGALFNRYGEVIGINSGIANSKHGILIGVSYAIPVNTARQVVDELRTGAPTWGYAGFEHQLAELNFEQAKIFGVPNSLSAVSLTRTPESGPAAEQMLARDVIYRVNGMPVKSVGYMKQMIGGHKPGDTLILDVMRKGEPRQISLVLENGWHPQSLSNAERYTGYLGMSLEMWQKNTTITRSFDTPVITRVQGLGPAHKGRISSSQHGFVYYGGMAMLRVFEVNTVTGVVFAGQYRAVDSIEMLNSIAERAYEQSEPILLEVQQWKREQPQKLDSELKYTATDYYSILPRRFHGVGSGYEVGGGNQNTELMHMAMLNL